MAAAAVPTLTVPARIIQALLAGEQVADLRGVGDGPPAGAARLWLRPDSDTDPELKPAYRRARDLSLPDAGPGPGRVRIDGWAEVVGAATTVVDDRVAESLNGKTILALGPFAGREVLVVALRVHRLVEPLVVPDDLAGLPEDPAQGPASQPALSEMAFRARYNGLVDTLAGGLEPLG